MIQRLTFIAILLFATNYFAVAQFSAEQKDLIVTPEGKNQVMDSILKRVTDSYVFTERIASIQRALINFKNSLYYDKIASSNAFADTVNNLLFHTSNDKHLRILFSHDTVPPKDNKEGPLPDFIKQFAIEYNYGFNKIEVLKGNIGYINILGFFPFEEATTNATAAFRFIENTRALIIDLRDNSGGVGGFDNFIISYFFDQRPLEFMEVRFRKDNRVEQAWSSFYIPGKRYLGKPVFVLTSSQTFSAGEGFAYTLQSLKRAIIVGETTGGGANLGDLVRINDHFVMNLPVGRPISPITNTNWEGTGVIPDIPVARDRALETAHIAAIKKLLESTTDEKLKDQLTEILADIQSAPK